MKRANSCRTSDRSACLFPQRPVPGLHDPGMLRGRHGSLLCALAARGRRARTNDARASAILKRRQPFTCFNRPEERKRRTDDEPEANTAYVVAAPQSRNRLKFKNAVGGRRKSLKRLDSAKEIEGFNLDFVPPGLDFLPKNLDFLPGEFGFPSSRRRRNSSQSSPTADTRRGLSDFLVRARSSAFASAPSESPSSRKIVRGWRQSLPSPRERLGVAGAVGAVVDQFFKKSTRQPPLSRSNHRSTTGKTMDFPLFSGDRIAPASLNCLGWATSSAGDFHVFPIPGPDRGLREHFLGLQAAIEFIVHFRSEHDIDRVARVAVAGRRRGRAQQDVNDKGAHGLSHAAGWPIPTAPRRLAMRSTRWLFPQETRQATQIPCQPRRDRPTIWHLGCFVVVFTISCLLRVVNILFCRRRNNGFRSAVLRS